jgi:hypothetical protein
MQQHTRPPNFFISSPPFFSFSSAKQDFSRHIKSEARNNFFPSKQKNLILLCILFKMTDKTLCGILHTFANFMPGTVGK